MDRPLPRIALVSTIDPPTSDKHWASPYYTLRRAFEISEEYRPHLVDDLRIADIVIICPRLNNPVFPAEILFKINSWKYFNKTIAFSTDDEPFISHPGVYTSIRIGNKYLLPFQDGFYPHVAFKDELDLCLHVHPSKLFSFRGDVATHPVRSEMMELSMDAWKILSNTRAFNFEYLNIQSPSLQKTVDQKKYGNDYISSLAASKFILCPRGRCPSSIRLFEAMRAGRVPVVISNEWAGMKRIPWDKFIVRISERDVENIPKILLEEEKSFFERSANARASWTEYFALESLPKTIILVANEIQQSRIDNRFNLFLFVGHQFFTWRFLRRGLLSEVRKFLKNRM